MIAIYLSKQQSLDADPRAIQQINFTANLDRAGNKQCFLLLKKEKKLSNPQLNKLMSSIKNETEVLLRLSSNMVGNSNDKTNFPHK